jgi:choice-of-anchor A domain-containing protein
MNIRTLAAACAALVVLPASAGAASLVDRGLDYMTQYNLIVLGDLNSNSEVEGRTFVGGNLSGNSSNYLIAGGDGSKPALQVVGQVTGDHKNLNNGADAEIGGSGTFNLNGSQNQIVLGGTFTGNIGGDDTVIQNDPDVYARLLAQKDDMILTLGELSAQLSLLAVTDAHDPPTNANNNKNVFDPDVVGADLAVFSLTTSQVNAFDRDLVFNVGDNDLVVVNVGGTTINIPSTMHFSGAGYGAKVIWNFYEAQTISFGDRFIGSVLAPKAAATNSNYIEGTAVFASFTQRGEIHVPDLSTDYRFGAVPEPASWAMMILGFGAAGSILRRGRAAVCA